MAPHITTCPLSAASHSLGPRHRGFGAGARLAGPRRLRYGQVMNDQPSARARHAAACRRLVKGTCQVCGAPTLGLAKRRYCSPRCRDRAYCGRLAARRLAPTAEAATVLVEGLRVAWPEVVKTVCMRALARQAARPAYRDRCPVCGDEFAATARQQYCSRHCANVAGYRRRKVRERAGVPTADQLVRGYLVRYAPKRRSPRAGGIL
jgi:predicted nucleic acid-binding Zn ribbon protein